MTRNHLASPPNEANPIAIDPALIERLTADIEALAKVLTISALELKCFTPEEAAPLLGKTENWVIESIQARRIPFTYVGKSPRMTAAHIRWVQADGEVKPSKYAIEAAV